MPNPIKYIDRATGELKIEQVYGEKALRFFYENPIGKSCVHLLAKLPIFSHFFGWWNGRRASRKKIHPFIEKYQLDPSIFQLTPDQFSSFNAFFTRKLKPDARPIGRGFIAPADGRYLCYQDIDACDGFVVKGKKFSIAEFIGSESLAEAYKGGSMVLIRLCPTDYHRFHFPCACVPNESKLIRGPLYSVNPISVKLKLERLSENKRMISSLQTEDYGRVLFIEIGATNVGSIHQTYVPKKPVEKGEEKGYFAFGGSSIAMIFTKKAIEFDKFLIKNSFYHTETLCLMGQPLEYNI